MTKYSIRFANHYTVNFPSNDGFVRKTRYIALVNPKGTLVAMMLESMHSVTYITSEGVFVKEHFNIPAKGFKDLYLELLHRGWVEVNRGFERA